MGRIGDAYDAVTIKFPRKYRLLMALAFVTVVALIALSTYIRKMQPSKDTNVYLNEEVRFADEVFIKADSICVLESEQSEDLDADGDTLSTYVLCLGVAVEQRNTDFWTNKVTIEPSNFSLRSVNLKARSKMSIFFECLAKESLAMLIGGAIEGSINIIDETINYIADYTSESIENAKYEDKGFKPIKCEEDCFEPFAPRKIDGPTHVLLRFQIKQEYLDSDNIMVLAVNAFLHNEQKIFLVTRPQ